MPRKNTDDPAARQAAADMLARSDTANIDRSEAGGIVGAFETAEFETGTARLSGRSVTMRRVVLTGHWEPVR